MPTASRPLRERGPWATSTITSMSTPVVQGVLIVDDHAVFAEALAASLNRSDRFVDVRWSQTAEEALELVRLRQPSLAIVDLRMPEVRGADLIEALAATNGMGVLVLSAADDARSILQVFEAGADGFLGKHESFEAVIRAANAVVAGENPISASAFTRLLPKLLRDDGGGLTAQEERVLLLLAEERSNEDISVALGVTYNTARNHVSSILRKMGARNRVQAVTIARERNLISRADDDQFSSG